MNKDKYFFSALVCLVLCSCNKDGVIEPETPNDGRRPITSASTPQQSMVYDYTPAPGQFINDTRTGGFTGEETTPAAACAYALERLNQQRFVSLGAFGGYIVVGFDHSIVNRGGAAYDFGIMGNAFDRQNGSSNEPGIVWVMQDTNHNGKPDDTWYQLAGSEAVASNVAYGYSVTYYRPDGPSMAVKWTDSEGASGTVDYLRSQHPQEYYYPAWITADSYTLTGTRLQPHAKQDPDTGDWLNPPYAWGYADNMGSDCIDSSAPDGEGQTVGFKIANAVDANGRQVNLPYIDFIKVQTALQSQSGRLGENSTEVLTFRDLNPSLN